VDRKVIVGSVVMEEHPPMEMNTVGMKVIMESVVMEVHPPVEMNTVVGGHGR